MMSKVLDPPGNIILLRGACLWLLMALVLAWCMVGLYVGFPYLKEIFPGKFSRILQGHIDFLLMTALILGIYATKTALPWHVRWAMVVGAFTNSSLFVLYAMFPSLDSPTPPPGFFPVLFKVYLYTSLVVTSYGFGRAAILIFLSTFDQPAAAAGLQPRFGDTQAFSVGAHYVGDMRQSRSFFSKLSRFFTPARRYALQRRISQLVVPKAGHDPVLLWMIFTGLSVLIFILLWVYGFAQAMLESDRTYISAVIVVLYLLTSLHCLWRALAMSREAHAAARAADIIKGKRQERLPHGAVASHIRDLRLKAEVNIGQKIDQTLMLRLLADRIRGSNDFGSFASDTLMKIGLFGTIVGFIMMLAPISGLDTDNATALKSSMGAMSDGMAVAMYTTLTGLVGSILVKIQYGMVDAAAENIFADAVELTEVYVVPALNVEAAAAP